SNSRGMRTALFRPFLKTLTWRSGPVLACFDGICQAYAKRGHLSIAARSSAGWSRVRRIGRGAGPSLCGRGVAALARPRSRSISECLTNPPQAFAEHFCVYSHADAEMVGHPEESAGH